MRRCSRSISARCCCWPWPAWLLGLALGLLLPLAVRLVPEGALPITPELGVYAGPLLRAALAGLLTTFVFALWPLAIAREISPASLFRALVAPVAALAAPALSRCCWRLAVAALVALAIVGVPQPGIGAWFVLTVAVAAVPALGPDPAGRARAPGASRIAAASPCGWRSPTCTGRARPRRA